MSNPFDDIRAAVGNVRHTLSAADSAACNMASLLIGRLRKVEPYQLVKLKRELQEFDAHKKTWKS